MTIKHIRWVACIGLLAIICLQYVWLVNTYKLTKESIQFRSNEVFRDATMREVFYRMEVYQDSLQKKYKDKDTSIMVRINLDEDYDFLRMAEVIKCEPMVDVQYAGFHARDCQEGL